MNIQVPSGFFKTTQHLSDRTVEWLRDAWNEYTGFVAAGKTAALVLPSGVEFVPLHSNVVPDAFCKYCGIANLNCSVWCSGCGAPLLRQ